MVYLVETVCHVLPWLYFCANEPRQVEHPVDAFKAFGKFPEVVVAYASTDCAKFICLNASRTVYDTQQKKVQYMWYYQGLNGTRTKSTSFDLHFGDVMDKPWYYIDGDNCHNYTAHVPYSDYHTCTVTIGTVPPDQLCLLWVKRHEATKIPQRCIDAFHQSCGEGFVDFSLDLC